MSATHMLTGYTLPCPNDGADLVVHVENGSTQPYEDEVRAVAGWSAVVVVRLPPLDQVGSIVRIAWPLRRQTDGVLRDYGGGSEKIELSRLEKN